MKYILIVILSIIIISCNNDDSYNIGESYFDITTNIRYVDTFSVSSYTVALDSIQTSGNNKALVGKYTDGEFGTLTAQSYFELGVPTTTVDIPTNAVFDSVSLVMIPDGYYVGDTTMLYGINLYELSEKITLGDESSYFYNTSKVSIKPDLLGSTSFYPWPKRGEDTAFISVNKEFGLGLYNKLIDDADEVSDDNNFIDYKNGFLVTPDGSNDQLVLRYDATDTTMFLRLHYHYIDYEYTKDFIDFPLVNDGKQFNNITRENSDLDTITSQLEKLPASETYNETYIQAGNPVVTRVEFNNIRTLLELYNNVNILKVYLVLEPISGTYLKNSLPKELMVYETDRLNQFGDEIYTLKAASQTGNLVKDTIYYEETNYSFEITSFIEANITNEEAPALLITIPADELYTTIDRCIIGSCNNRESKLVLKIYYMDYE